MSQTSFIYKTTERRYYLLVPLKRRYRDANNEQNVYYYGNISFIIFLIATSIFSFLMASFSFFSEKKALVQSWYSGHPWRLVVNFFFHAIHFLCVVLMKTTNASDERDDCISKNKMTTLDVEDFSYRPVPCYPHINIYRENPAAFFFFSICSPFVRVFD